MQKIAVIGPRSSAIELQHHDSNDSISRPYQLPSCLLFFLKILTILLSMLTPLFINDSFQVEFSLIVSQSSNVCRSTFRRHWIQPALLHAEANNTVLQIDTI